MVDLKDAKPVDWHRYEVRVEACFRSLQSVQHLGKAYIGSGSQREDVARRACAAAALQEGAIDLLQLKFVAISQNRSRVFDTLHAARGALLAADWFLEQLFRSPIRRRAAALWRRVRTGQKSVGFDDLRTASRESQRAVNSVLLSILIVIAANKKRHVTLASLLGSTIEDVVAQVRSNLPPPNTELPDAARLLFAVINARLILLAYGETAVTARCRAHLYLLEAYINYYAYRLTRNNRRRETFIRQAKSALVASRRSEWKAVELVLTRPFRAIAGTRTDLPPAPWVRNVPAYPTRWAMRRTLKRKTDESK